MDGMIDNDGDDDNYLMTSLNSKKYKYRDLNLRPVDLQTEVSPLELFKKW